MRFEIFSRVTRFRRRKLWFWRLRSTNNEIISQSEAYRSRTAAVKTCEAIKHGVDPTTLVIDKDD